MICNGQTKMKLLYYSSFSELQPTIIESTCKTHHIRGRVCGGRGGVSPSSHQEKFYPPIYLLSKKVLSSSVYFKSKPIK